MEDDITTHIVLGICFLSVAMLIAQIIRWMV